MLVNHNIFYIVFLIMHLYCDYYKVELYALNLQCFQSVTKCTATSTVLVILIKACATTYNRALLEIYMFTTSREV